jgi:hypothetical protein
MIFFTIIGLTMTFIGLVAGLGRLFDRPVLSPDAQATATVASFFATVEAETGANAIEMSGLPDVSLGNHTWDGLAFDIQVNYDAWPLVKLENQFNSPPQEGKRMIMVTLAATNIVGGDAVPLAASNFHIVGEYNIPYSPYATDTRCGVIPERLSGKIKPGETIRGNICIQVPIAEGGLVLVYDGYGSDHPKMFFLLPEAGP